MHLAKIVEGLRAAYRAMGRLQSFESPQVVLVLVTRRHLVRSPSLGALGPW